MSAVRDISQGCGEEPQPWLGKAKGWAGDHLPLWGSEALRGGKTPALMVVATVGVVAGLDFKPGLCTPTGHMSLVEDGLRRGKRR